MEGVLAEISPEINICPDCGSRIRSEFFQKKNIKKVLHNDARGCTSLFTRRSIYRTACRICCGIIPKENPEFICDLHISKDFSKLLARLDPQYCTGDYG